MNLCLHCQSCSGGCPFTAAMDLLPNRVLRLIQLGKGDLPKNGWFERQLIDPRPMLYSKQLF
ncbi:MAG: hypothetical protein KFF68_02860 [Desulfosarcina sp.]|nr:hypothetical protein [Desulfosarcina sp.]